jgi:endoglucanase
METMEKLSGVHGPAGFEGAVARTAMELLEPLVDEVHLDRLGNVVGVKACGREGAYKLLLDAHLDEVGFIVMGHEEGFLRFASLGGVDARILPDRELTILTDPPLFGVVATKPPHVMAEGESDKTIALSDLRIDVGFSQEEATRRIPVGNPAVFREGCYALGADRIAGKALDDRSCFAVLLETLRMLQKSALDVDVYVLGSCREEINSAGATVGTYGIHPELAVAVDVTFGRSIDSPDEKTFPLGSGPVIGIGPNMAGWMTERLVKKAEELELPYQMEVMSGSSGTNGWEIQVSREGVATAILSLPLNYMHMPLEVIHQSDVENCSKLLAAFIENLGEEAALC